MALCEGKLDSVMKEDENKSNIPKIPPPMLAVDYTSPRSHFVPQEIEMYSNQNQHSSATIVSSAQMHRPHTSRHSEDSRTTSPEMANTPKGSGTVKRKRGRPRVDKTSPEYQAMHAARMRARHEQALMKSANSNSSGEKRKRGRPRLDKTSPEYIARKLQRERELLAKKAQKQMKRRNTGDSNASNSSANRMKRKYTKKGEEMKKRGRKKKTVIGPDGQPIPNQTTPNKKSRVLKNPFVGSIINAEPIPVDSDDEQGSPRSNRSDSISFDENYRALRHLHEKYANIGQEDYTILQSKQPERRSSSSSSTSSSSGSSSGGSSSDSSSGSSSSSSSDNSDSESESEAKNGKKVITNGDLASGKSDKDGADKDKNQDSSDDDSVNEDYGEPGSGSLSESENESIDKRFQCHYCHKWYSTLVTLKIHRRIHLNRGKQQPLTHQELLSSSTHSSSRRREPERYECDLCLMTFTRREKLWDHKSSVHRGAMTVRCSVCRRAFEDESELAAHTHTLDEKQGRCSVCGCTFPRYELLRRHRYSAHPTVFSSANGHSCPQCNKHFSHPHSLARHLHNHANTIYKCVVCKQVYNDSESLATHLNSHLATYKKLKP